MPLRSPKMYFCIFGFQRLLWWPKWTPASSSSFIVRAAISPPRFASAALPGHRPGPTHARRAMWTLTARGRQMSRGVRRVQPELLLADVGRPDALLAPTQPQVDGDRVFRPSHDLANALQAHAIEEHPALADGLVV